MECSRAQSFREAGVAWTETIDMLRERARAEPRELGEMGLEYVQAGTVIQSLARVIVDRGYDFDDVKRRLIEWSETYREDTWWDRYGGPAVDQLESALGYGPEDRP